MKYRISEDNIEYHGLHWYEQGRIMGKRSAETYGEKLAIGIRGILAHYAEYDLPERQWRVMWSYYQLGMNETNVEYDGRGNLYDHHRG